MLKPNDRSKGNPEGSESITFRMGKPILYELRQEAEQKMESINTLVNQIVKLYITWHKPAKQAGYGYFDKVLVSDIINLLSDEQIVKMAEHYCKHRLKDIVFMLNSENTFSFFMDGIISWIEASGFNYKYSNNNSGDFNTLVIHFDMGKNWSFFFKTYIQSVLEYYKITDGQCEMTDNTVVIRINN
jgi:hypothetical protein